MHAVTFALSMAPGVPWAEAWRTPLFLYFSPDTILPVASILGGIIGVGLMFGRYFISLIKKAMGRAPAAAAEGAVEIEDIDLSLDGEPGPRSEEPAR